MGAQAMMIFKKVLCCSSILVILTGAVFGADEAVSSSSADEKAAIESVAKEPVKAAGGSANAEVKPVKDEPLTLWRIFLLGGNLMWVLAFLSFASIVLITFYFLSLTPSNAIPPLFAQRLHELLANRRVAEAATFCEQHDNSLSRILRKGITAMDRGRDAIVEAMQSEGQRQASVFWQRISYLSDVGIVAPMVGLLGTVLGMMHLFMGIRTSLAIGGFKPDQLAGGIFEAIITTVAGLIIAIISTCFYSYFRGVVQRIIISLEEISIRYADLLEGGYKK
jgi:biopolymer transport protein ExbB